MVRHSEFIRMVRLRLLLFRLRNSNLRLSKMPHIILYSLILVAILKHWYAEQLTSKSPSITRFFQKCLYPTWSNSTLPTIEPQPLVGQTLILSWTYFFGVKFDEGDLKCPETPGCILTHDQSSLDQSQAVVFHESDLNWRYLPKPRLSNQYYVYFTWESPSHSRHEMPESWQRSFFNLTMTYRRDSDVYAPYGNVIRRKSPLKVDLRELAKNKTRPIAWLVSNCHAESKRELLVSLIRKHLPVDIYGRCGHRTCLKDNQKSKSDKNRCGHIFEQGYKFYLAFENSLHPNYVTEKFYRRIQSYLVPIVLQRQNYEHFCPEYTKPWFIAVDDFGNFEDFVAYLKYLHSNHSAYYEYLSWHEQYETIMHVNSDTEFVSNDHWCSLCRVVRTKKQKIIENVDKWWKEGACQAASVVIPKSHCQLCFSALVLMSYFWLF